MGIDKDDEEKANKKITIIKEIGSRKGKIG